LRCSLCSGIRLQVHGGKAQLVTAPENAAVVQRFLGTAKPPALSRAALEALTVIAYRQPVTRSEIEAARGVNSDRAVQTLLARGLIEERGQRETLGRPMQYGTTFGFLEYFGLASLDELPPLSEEQPQDEPDVGLRKPSTP
jgi:segregation and condensation protein B